MLLVIINKIGLVKTTGGYDITFCFVHNSQKLCVQKKARQHKLDITVIILLSSDSKTWYHGATSAHRLTIFYTFFFRCEVQVRLHWLDPAVDHQRGYERTAEEKQLYEHYTYFKAIIDSDGNEQITLEELKDSQTHVGDLGG